MRVFVPIEERGMLKWQSACRSVTENEGEQGCTANFCRNLHAAYKNPVVVTIVTGMFIIHISAVVIAVKKSNGYSPEPCATSRCPEGWIQDQGQCCYFAKDERNWNDSQTFCSSHDASLVMLDLQKLRSLLPYEGKLDHWIGLWKDTHQVWRWANGTEFDGRFKIQEGGDCAFLDEDLTIGSSSCSTQRKSICYLLDVHHSKRD